MHDHVVPRRVYYTVFVILLGLLALTVAAAKADLGKLHTVTALGIAVAKAVLIALYFMHLRYNRPLVGLAATAGILWLLILAGLTFGEIVSRQWPTTSVGMHGPSNGINHVFPAGAVRFFARWAVLRHQS